MSYLIGIYPRWLFLGWWLYFYLLVITLHCDVRSWVTFIMRSCFVFVGAWAWYDMVGLFSANLCIFRWAYACRAFACVNYYVGAAWSETWLMKALPSHLCYKSHCISYVLHYILWIWVIEGKKVQLPLKWVWFWDTSRSSTWCYYGCFGTWWQWQRLLWWCGIHNVDLVACLWLLADLYTRSWTLVCVLCGFQGPNVCNLLCFWDWCMHRYMA